MKKTIFYEVNPRFFKDSNGDGVGDLPGMISKFDYFNHLGVEAIILQNIVAANKDSQKTPFCKVDLTIGTNDDLEILTSLAKKYHQKIIMEIDLGFIYKQYYWFKNKQKDKNLKADTNLKQENLKNEKSILNNEPSQKELKIWKNEIAIKNFLKIFNFWKQLGVNGFLFENFEYLTDEAEVETMNKQTLIELRKIYYLIKAVDKEFILIARSNLIKLSEGQKYANPGSKLFDYFMSLEVPFLGISSKNGLDEISHFNAKIYSSFLKENYAQNKNNIIAFNSKTIGKALSRWTDDEEYIFESAKTLAILLMINGASPLIYAGDEIGLSNLELSKHDDFEALGFEERKLTNAMNNLSKEQFYKAQIINSPLNSQALMIWNETKNGGFSSAKKMTIPISRKIADINVKLQYKTSNSILNFYRQLIQLVRFSSFTDLLNKGEIKVTKFLTGVIKYKITSFEEKLDVIINLTDTKKVNLGRSRQDIVIFSSYNRAYDKVPRVLEPYESLIIAFKNPKYFKTTQQIEIEKARKAQVEKQSRHRAKIRAKMQQEKEREIIKQNREKMIDEKIKIAQKEEREKLFKKHQSNKNINSKQVKNKNPNLTNLEIKEEKMIKDKKANVQSKTETEEANNNPFATNDLELKDVKKNAQIDREVDVSHLDEATKLKEEELAKTTLLDDSADLDKLFEEENIKKNKS